MWSFTDSHLADALARMGRTPAAGRLLNWMISKMSFVLPVERVFETEHLLAFFHPMPAYPLHLLLLPKKEINSLTALSPADQPFLQELFSAVQQLVKRYDLETRGYRLIANGGPYQDFPRLHFHLVSGPPLSQAAA